VTLPEHLEQSFATAVGEQLLTIIDGDVRVLILDMTGTAACDHVGGDMLARVYHRAVARGTALRLVAGGEKVLRVLALTGIDRLVPVHATVGAALAATAPGESTARAETSLRAETSAQAGGSGQPGRTGPPPADDVDLRPAGRRRAERRGHGHALPDEVTDAGRAADGPAGRARRGQPVRRVRRAGRPGP
jgi:anti-anti-sigma factor